jgi:hypothetical protein
MPTRSEGSTTLVQPPPRPKGTEVEVQEGQVWQWAELMRGGLGLRPECRGEMQVDDRVAGQRAVGHGG